VDVGRHAAVHVHDAAHFIDAQWRLRAFTVACCPLPRPHTGAALLEAPRANLAAIDLDRFGGAPSRCR
jgi:hypothetical protein